MVEEYVRKHQPDANSEERWRTAMMHLVNELRRELPSTILVQAGHAGRLSLRSVLVYSGEDRGPELCADLAENATRFQCRGEDRREGLGLQIRRRHGGSHKKAS